MRRTYSKTKHPQDHDPRCGEPWPHLSSSLPLKRGAKPATRIANQTQPITTRAHTTGSHAGHDAPGPTSTSASSTLAGTSSGSV